METSWDYPSKHLRGLYKMRKQNQLCDVTIQVGLRKFSAHKAVLAATGDYFLTMFTSGFRESSAPEISIEGSADAFEILLNFVYTGRVDSTKVASCMYDVLDMARYMHFRDFAETCSLAIRKLLKTATEDISVTDVCKVMLLAQTHNYLSSLYKATLQYLENKVECLKSLDLFLENISATFLQDFLGRENLSTADEEEHVLELVINWLKHDWEKRKGHSCQLLKKVRLGLVASEDIKKLIGPEILEIRGCSEFVNRVLDLQASEKPKETMAIENPGIAASRSNVMAPVMMASQGNLEYYDVERKKWVGMKKMAPLTSKTGNYELIVVNGILYAAGGTNGKEFLKYQASENKWLPLPPKPLGKNCLKLVALGAYIYAFGACCEPDEFMVERYDINTMKWKVQKKAKESKSTSKFTLVAMDTAMPTSNCCGWHPSSDVDLHDYYSFAVVFEGKIYVSSLEQEADWKDSNYSVWGEPEDLHYLVEKMTIFDPEAKTCQVSDLGSKRREEEHGDWEETCFKPTLFIYKDFLYRMILESGPDECSVYVSKLSLTYKEDGSVSAALGKELKPGLQLYEITNDEAPFYIQDKMFANRKHKGNASKKDTKASRRDKVKPFPQYGENKQLMCTTDDQSESYYPVWFSFEKKKLTVPKKKRSYFDDDDDDDSSDDIDEDSYDDEEEEEDASSDEEDVYF